MLVSDIRVGRCYALIQGNAVVTSIEPREGKWKPATVRGYYRDTFSFGETFVAFLHAFARAARADITEDLLYPSRHSPLLDNSTQG